MQLTVTVIVCGFVFVPVCIKSSQTHQQHISMLAKDTAVIELRSLHNFWWQRWWWCACLCVALMWLFCFFLSELGVLWWKPVKLKVSFDAVKIINPKIVKGWIFRETFHSPCRLGLYFLHIEDGEKVGPHQSKATSCVSGTEPAVTKSHTPAPFNLCVCDVCACVYVDDFYDARKWTLYTYRRNNTPK